IPFDVNVVVDVGFGESILAGWPEHLADGARVLQDHSKVSRLADVRFPDGPVPGTHGKDARAVNDQQVTQKIEAGLDGGVLGRNGGHRHDLSSNLHEDCSRLLRRVGSLNTCYCNLRGGEFQLTAKPMAFRVTPETASSSECRTCY